MRPDHTATSKEDGLDSGAGSAIYTGMDPRQKKLILVLGFLPALIIYMGLVLAISDRIPDHWLVQLLFYIVAGTIWAFPMKPVMAWVNSPAPSAEEGRD